MIAEYFNTSPLPKVAPETYGNSGRKIITGGCSDPDTHAKSSTLGESVLQGPLAKSSSHKNCSVSVRAGQRPPLDALKMEA
jgi:hypothetical protein